MLNMRTIVKAVIVLSSLLALPIHAEQRKIGVEEYKRRFNMNDDGSKAEISSDLAQKVLADGEILITSQIEAKNLHLIRNSMLILYKSDYFQCNFWSQHMKQHTIWCSEYSFR